MSDYNAAIQDAAKIAERGADLVDTLAPISADDETAKAIIQKSRDNMKRVASGIAKKIRSLKRPEPDAAVAQDVVDRAQKLIREEIVRQYRDNEREKCPAGAFYYEEEIGPYSIALVLASAGLLPVQDGGWRTIETWKPKGAEANWPYLNALICVDGNVGEGCWKPGDNPPETGEWWWANLDSEYGDVVYPSHWQPLPAPPVQGGE